MVKTQASTEKVNIYQKQIYISNKYINIYISNKYISKQMQNPKEDETIVSLKNTYKMINM